MQKRIFTKHNTISSQKLYQITKAFRKEQLMTSFSFTNCEDDKISDIKRLSDDNHITIRWSSLLDLLFL